MKSRMVSRRAPPALLSIVAALAFAAAGPAWAQDAPTGSWAAEADGDTFGIGLLVARRGDGVGVAATGAPGRSTSEGGAFREGLPSNSRAGAVTTWATPRAAPQPTAANPNKMSNPAAGFIRLL